MDIWGPLQRISSRAAHVKFISATAVADDGDSQALALAPARASFTTFEFGAISLTNRSGGAATVGLAVRLPRERWGAGQVTAAGVFTDDTVDAQDIDANDFSLHDRTDSGSGFIVHADAPFNVLSIVQTTAGDQTTPVLLLEYWNGTSWIDIAVANYGGDTLNPGATNERLMCFAMPTPWVKGGSGTNIRQDRYNLRVRYTTAGAGTVNPLAAQMFVGITVWLVPALADSGSVTLIQSEGLRAHRYGDAIFPIFGVVGVDNEIDVSYRFV